MARGVYARVNTMGRRVDVWLVFKVDICAVRPGVSLANGKQSLWEVLLVPHSVC